MDSFKKLLMEKAKEGKFIDKDKASRKMEVLGEIDEIMSGEMGDKIKGLQKVTVASPTKEGLEAGIEKASEVVEELPEEEDESELSEEEILAKIEELKSMLPGNSEEEETENSHYEE